MDFGKTNQALNSKTHHDFDLNMPSMEELYSNTENEFSPLIHMSTSQASQNVTDNMNMAGANNGDNEVHQSSAVDTTPAGSAAAAGASSDDMRALLNPKYIISFETASPGRSTLSSRRRYRRRGEVQYSDPSRYCTNYHCRTRKTPLWRKGPLGPKTLCNACGIHYMKQVTSRGSGVDLAVPGDRYASRSAVPVHNDASPSAVPAETARGGPKY